MKGRRGREARRRVGSFEDDWGEEGSGFEGSCGKVVAGVEFGTGEGRVGFGGRGKRLGAGEIEKGRRGRRARE